jgi:hypothetical protein
LIDDHRQVVLGKAQVSIGKWTLWRSLAVLGQRAFPRGQKNPDHCACFESHQAHDKAPQLSLSLGQALAV